MNLNNNFATFATAVTKFTGSSKAFLTSFFLVCGWAISGPIFHYSENWQLFINTSTTIITFLMVFLIQFSQNKDTKAIHLKLDELVRANEKADDKLRGIEQKTEEQIEEIKKEL